MPKIDTKAWKSFRVCSDLGFVCYHGQRLNKAERLDGNIPFLTAGFENCGVAQFIGNDRIVYHKPITIDMFGNCFFHSADCAGDDNVYFFVNDAISDLCKLFLATCIMSLTSAAFEYSHQFRQNDADMLSVILPVDSTGQPDWAYMDAYMSEVLKKEEVFAEHLASLTAEAVADGHKLDTSGWKAFRIGELFEVLLAKGDIQPKQVADGTIPLVSAGNEDNGIVSFIDLAGDGVSEMFPAGCITVSMFGKAFYQPECFYAVSHGRINVLRSKIEFSSIVGAFLAACLSHVLGSKYDYATMCTQKKLVSEEIYLPVTADGQPDWAWMEYYMQQQMDKAEALVEHLDAVWG